MKIIELQENKNWNEQSSTVEEPSSMRIISET